MFNSKDLNKLNLEGCILLEFEIHEMLLFPNFKGLPVSRSKQHASQP
jgi:hypothetical protein